jgi:flagellar L-ring protein precursor FlgH
MDAIVGRWMTRWLRLVAVVAIAAGTGCNSLPDKAEPGYEAVLPPPLPETVQQQTGTIYQAGYNLTLFEDVHAHRVGDILRVLLVEQTDARKRSATNLDKKTSSSYANPILFGKPRDIDGNTLGVELDGESEFSGSGDSDQSNRLQGSITVSVAQVLSNGNLMIQGEKWVQINQGSEFVRVKGIVRPVDIAANNTVLSTQIADARLSYGGKGATAEPNAVGWMARFFMSPLWPF